MDDVLSNFLIKITYDQDQKSRKDFDNSLKQVQTHAAEFGEKIGALPFIVSEATKRISSSLSELWYSGQKTQATAEQIDALRRAAVQSGEGADNAERSWNAFSERLRYFGDAAGKQLKQIFPDVTDYDPKKKFDSFLKAKEEFSREYNAATDKEGKGRVLARGEPFGFGEESAVKDRQERFNEYFKNQLEANSGIEAEKAAALTRAYNALADALETVARKADAALFDKFGAVLDRLTRWLDEDSERIVKFFTDLVTQIGLVFTDLSKLGPAFSFLWDALKEVGGWLQKIIGQPDGSGLAGVRHLLEFISGVVMARFVVSMVAGFIAAFAPLTALIATLAALGIISVGAYTVGEAIHGWLGGGTSGGGFGPGEGTASGGHGATRRGRFGHGGAAAAAGTSAGGGNGPAGGGKPGRGEYTVKRAYDLIKAAGGTDEEARILAAISQPESRGNPRAYNPNAATGDLSYGLWQINMLGAMGPERRAKYGLKSNEDLFDPATNARVALAMARARGGYKDWSTYKSGAYKQYLSAHGDQPNAAAHPLARLSGPGVDFHKRLDEIRAAKPSTPWQQSSNEIHDHRAVTNDVNIHVAGGFPVEKTERPLSRPRNADLIRNTASYAA